MLLISLLLVIGTVPAHNDVNTETLALIESMHVLHQQSTSDHPSMIELREDISQRKLEHFRFDLPTVQERLQELVEQRHLLTRKYKLAHPSVIENAIRISVVSRILAGESAAMLAEIRSVHVR